MRKSKKVLPIVIVFILFLGCSIKPSTRLDLGYMEGSKYVNVFFGLQMEIPEEWALMSEEEKMEIIQLGQDLAIGSDEDLSKLMVEGRIDSFYLLAASKYRDEERSEFNPSINCIVEYLSGFFAADNGMEYLEYKKEELKSTQIPFEFEKEIYIEDIGGRKFFVMETHIEFGEFGNLSELTVTQKYYVKIIDNYALNFIISYSNENEKKELENILNSIVFNDYKKVQ
ncbi:UNVERIFIED_CONTAM: hypothetical protein Cloal_1397 [Acetivibrio alkalicellulosi]